MPDTASTRTGPMVELGLFSDEGCVEDCLWSLEEAQARLAAYHADDGLEVAEVCPEHRDHRASCCEECMADDDAED